MNEALRALFTSRVRLKILRLFLTNSTQMYYVRQVTRLVNEEVNAVRRELERLKKIGLLKTEPRGNRIYYRVRKDFIFYPELLSLIGKVTNLGAKILRNRDKLGQIEFAALSREFVAGREPEPKDVDLLIVGRIDLAQLQAIIRQAEAEHGHEINYTVLSEDELNFRKKRNDAFIRGVLLQPLIMLVGNEVKLKSW